ncbi:MAG: hypothetical protein ACK5IP_06330 [Paracoccus sp. (in: a-proteobacteria)]
MEEDERIRQWREERARVAEEERAKRIAKAEEEKQLRVEEAAREREAAARLAAREAQAAAAELLPTDAEIARARAALLGRMRRARCSFLLQVLLCVVIPTACVVYYYVEKATPLYETTSVISVSRALQENSGNLGGVLTGSASDTLKETYQAFSYLNSEALMRELERRNGAVSRFSSDRIDPLRRLYDIPDLGITHYDGFSRFVKSSFDRQSGQITLHVAADDAQFAYQLAQSIIHISSAKVNDIADELYAKRVSEAERASSHARTTLRDAQRALTRLQIETGELDPRARVETVFQVISALSVEAANLRSEIDQAEVAGPRNTRQTDQLRQRLMLLQQRISNERERLVRRDDGETGSLGTALLRYELAQLDLRVSEEQLSTSFASLELARQEAALGQNIFQVIVPPVVADYPTDPKPPRILILSIILFSALLGAIRVTFAGK